MTDYDWSIGSNGTMRIRDTGTYVEFWITANNTTTSASALPWGYTVNGVTDNTNAFDYNAGAYWERLGRWLVTTDQTVTFRLFETGTSGLGSGETHSVAINRTSAPAKPPRWMVEQIWDTRVQGDVDGADTGGLTLTSSRCDIRSARRRPRRCIRVTQTWTVISRSRVLLAEPGTTSGCARTTRRVGAPGLTSSLL